MRTGEPAVRRARGRRGRFVPEDPGAPRRPGHCRDHAGGHGAVGSRRRGGDVAARLDVCGILALGDGPEVSLAYLVEPDPELAEAVARLRASVPGLRRAVWLPHVTVAHRVPRRKVPEAMAEMGGIPGSFFATQLRYVDSRAHEAQTLVGVSSSVL